MKKLNAALVAAFFLLFAYQTKADEAPWLNVAQHYIGTGPKALGVRRTLWCAAGLNAFLRKAGYSGTGSDMAASFARYGSSSGPRRGAIAVMSRGRRGGHVGIVLEDKGRYVKVLSANHGGKTAVGLYPKSRIYAYRWPERYVRYANVNKRSHYTR